MVSDRSPCRVLICDDQAGFRQLVCIVLGLDPDIDVVGEATDGLEAIAHAERLQPDVLLLDIAMPELDGLEALPRIRTVAPGTRVVMLTGVTAASIRERARAGGAYAFIEKGVDVDLLGEQIKQACEDGSTAS